MDAELSLAVRRALPRDVQLIAHTLKKSSHRTWVVGGSVRDVLRQKLRGNSEPLKGDWDLATSARPEEVQKLFRKVIPTGIKHGTVTVVLEGAHYEVTTLRGERGFSDGRRPDEVVFVDDLREDLARRDFTVNAIAYDLGEEVLIDPFSGIVDLQNNILRAVGEPLERYSEDGLRVLRAARFASTLGIELEAQTKAAIRPSLPSFRKVSVERVRDEWWRALKSRAPSRCFRIMHSEGMLEITAPELFAEERARSFDTAMELLDRSTRDALVRFSLLLSLGLEGEGQLRLDAAARFAEQFRLSSQEQNTTLLYLAAEELPDGDEGYALRRYLSRLGRENAESALNYVAVRFPEGTEQRENTLGLLTLLRRELSSGGALSLKELAVRGGDLLAARIVDKGPELGAVLARLLDHVLRVPEDNRAERLLSLATDYKKP